MEDSNLFEELRIRDIELRKKWMEGDLTKLTGKPSKDKPHLKFYPEYALQGKLPEDTLYGYLYECNKAHMDDIAIVFDPEVQGKKYTYKDLFIEIDAMREVPKAHLILFVDSEAKRKNAINEVRKQIELKLGKDVVPRYFEFHESFPYTSNSKIDYISLRSDDWAKMRS